MSVATLSTLPLISVELLAAPTFCIVCVSRRELLTSPADVTDASDIVSGVKVCERVTVRAVVSVVLWRGRRETLLVRQQISLAEVEWGAMVERLELRERDRPEERRLRRSDSLAEALVRPLRKPVHTGIRVTDEETEYVADRDTRKLFGKEMLVLWRTPCECMCVCACVCVCLRACVRA